MNAAPLFPRPSLRHVRRSFPALLAGVVMIWTGCVDQATDPDASMTAVLALATVFPPDASSQASFVDAWRVQVSRPGGGVIAEESGAVGPEQETVSVQISVTLETSCETLSIRVELSSGGEIWFRSEEDHQVCSGTGNEVQFLELQWVRPQPTVGPGSLLFNIEEGGTSNSTFRITYDGTDDLIWTAQVQEGNADWVNLQPPSGSVTADQPNDVTVAINTLGLTPGRYIAHVVVMGEGFSDPIGEVLVDLTVTQGPRIGLSTTSLSFATDEGASPPQQTFGLTNLGGGTLHWNAADNAGWLDLLTTSGSLGPSQSQTITVTVNSESLSPGSYVAAITVSDPNADNSPRIIAVTLNVSEDPEIGLSTTSLSFATDEGASADTQFYAISNVGGGTLNWSSSDNAGWLDLLTTSGSLGPGQVWIDTVIVNSESLSPGSYVAAITITDPNATNSPQIISVTLNVSKDPEIGLSTNSLSFTTLQGTSPSGKLLTVFNSGGGVLRWQASDDVGWLSVSPPSGILGAGLAQWLTASINSDKLESGSYLATITIQDPEASNSPRTISVSLTVNPLSAPTLSNLLWTMLELNDTTCANSGSRFEFTFNYADPDGDILITGDTFTGSPIALAWHFMPAGFSGSFFLTAGVDGTAYSGTAKFQMCIAYQPEANTSMDIGVSLVDSGNRQSNQLGVNIPRPPGGNSPPQSSVYRSGGVW